MRTRIILEALPFLLVLGILLFTNIVIRKRHRNSRSEWNQIYDAAQSARQQVLQAARLATAGLPATPLAVATPPDMPKLKLS